MSPFPLNKTASEWCKENIGDNEMNNTQDIIIKEIDRKIKEIVKVQDPGEFSSGYLEALMDLRVFTEELS